MEMLHFLFFVLFFVGIPMLMTWGMSRLLPNPEKPGSYNLTTYEVAKDDIFCPNGGAILWGIGLFLFFCFSMLFMGGLIETWEWWTGKSNSITLPFVSLTFLALALCCFIFPRGYFYILKREGIAEFRFHQKKSLISYSQVKKASFIEEYTHMKSGSVIFGFRLALYLLDRRRVEFPNIIEDLTYQELDKIGKWLLENNILAFIQQSETGRKGEKGFMSELDGDKKLTVILNLLKRNPDSGFK